MAAKGCAEEEEELGCVQGTEDTITLLVEWVNGLPGNENKSATGVYTASWTASAKCRCSL